MKSLNVMKTMVLTLVLMMICSAASAAQFSLEDFNNDLIVLAGNYSRAADASGSNIFKTIAVRMMVVVRDLRMLAYIIAGFGMIAFTFAAIFNKISWKHFSNIMISLFILSMMTPLIEMVIFDNDSQHLEFGSVVASGDHEQFMVQGSDVSKQANAKEGETPTSPTTPEDGPATTPEGEKLEELRPDASLSVGDSPSSIEAELAKPKVAEKELTDKEKRQERNDQIKALRTMEKNASTPEEKAALRDQRRALQRENLQQTMKNVQHAANAVKDKVNDAQRIISTAGGMASTATAMVKSTKNAVNYGKSGAEKIKNGDVFGGLSTMYGGIDSWGRTMTSGSSIIMSGTSNIINAGQDLGSSYEQSQQNKSDRTNGKSTNSASDILDDSASFTRDVGNTVTGIGSATVGGAIAAGGQTQGMTGAATNSFGNLYDEVSHW